MTKDYYRSCASIVVLKKSPNGYKVLLLRKPRKKDAWQLPQGGVEEGETVSEAAVRELKEEANIDTTVIQESGLIYQYDYPASYRKFRPDNVCGQKIEFVFAQVDPSVTVEVDNHEIDAYVWVSPEDVGRYIKRKEYLSLLQELIQDALNLVGSTS